MRISEIDRANLRRIIVDASVANALTVRAYNGYGSPVGDEPVELEVYNDNAAVTMPTLGTLLNQTGVVNTATAGGVPFVRALATTNDGATPNHPEYRGMATFETLTAARRYLVRCGGAMLTGTVTSP